MTRPTLRGEPMRTGKALRVVPWREADWMLAPNIGERIRAVREEQDVTQDELAAACETDRHTVSKWELGRRLVPIRRLYQIAQALGVKMADLLPEHL